MSSEYIVIPGTNRKVYEGSIVVLNRLPNLKWILHYGPYFYEGLRKKGWYFSSIPADTTMPVFQEDLVNMVVIDDPVGPYPPGPHPFPPGPGPFPPGPPVPVPTPFTPFDKKQLNQAMLTVNTITERDKIGNYCLQDGKIVRVNDIDGHGTVEYYEWCAATSSWREATLGERYMTRQEITDEISDTLIDASWDAQEGKLEFTTKGSDPVLTPLEGLAHDVVYTSEELTIRIPIYGRPDCVVKIPADSHISAIRFEPAWEFDDHTVKPAIVVTVTDGTEEHDIAGDATGLYNIYKGKETSTAKVIITSETSEIAVNVKISDDANNSLRVDENNGLLVDLTGYVQKVQINDNFVLVADGQGGFKRAKDGIIIEQTTPISELTDPGHSIVTANLIEQAIAAAIEAAIVDVNERLASIERRLDFGEGTNGDVLVTHGDGLLRSGRKIGGSELPEEGSTNIATEQAVVDSLSWKPF